MRNSIYIQNKHLQNNCGLSNIFGTTKTINADRKRYLSGIFLPQIYHSHGLTTPENYSKFAVRATRRNKTGNRANNADCLMAVVEPLSHLSFLCDKPLNPNKGDHAMTIQTINANRKRNLAVFSPLFVLLSDAIEGGFYA
ncbi:hypothetical protein [Mannheimia haemolytica]|uniref:hypothetical protein n=1 Tax=Mannheimia haemolytica TaxID=75985 RepID=UPI000385A52D|nr:hypothetical protein [Mannheimia haemolytica]EPY99248.1 hypothetical protein L278_10735 [Mannheimia haemolytica D35]TRC50589.1 hypothetical protein FEA40_01115 [Mannheimia haemolytica]TRC50887.1 hypothetical protein FEA32_01115 [Mannheimia haemolytica]